MSKCEHAGYIYVQFDKGMYGLAQAGLLENELLAKRLSKHGFNETPHKSHPIRTSSGQFWHQVQE